MTRYWKFLNADLTPCHGGSGAWVVGQWREVSGNVVPCQNAIHACRPRDLTSWLGPALHPIELSEDVQVHDSKVYARAGVIGPRVEPGLNDQTWRLFAADCAARVKHIAKDKRSTAAIVLARAYAFGMIGPQPLGRRMLAYACGGIDLDALRLSTASAVHEALKAIGWTGRRK